MRFQGCAVTVIVLSLFKVDSADLRAAEPASVPAGTALDDIKCPAWKTVDLAPFFPAGMEKPFPEDVNGLTLEQFLQLFKQATGVTIGLDRRELRESGVDPEATVSRQLKGLPRSIALDLVLLDFHGHELRWVLDRGRYFVVTSRKARSLKRLATLEIGPLLDEGYSAEALQRLAIRLSSGPWRETDGEGGTIKIVGDRMNVLATDDSIREVQVILRALASREPVIDLYRSPADEKVRDALQMPVACEFTNAPLATVLKELGRQTGIIVSLDSSELQLAATATDEVAQPAKSIFPRERPDADVTRPDLPVSLITSKETLRQALARLLMEVAGDDLTMLIEHGALRVAVATTKEPESVRIYDIPEIAERGDTQSLISLIQDLTNGPWQAIDGEGGTIENPRPRTLIIRQTERVLLEVERLIAAHRGGKARPKPVGNAVEIRHYRLSAQMAEDLLTLIPRFVAVDEWKDFPDGSSPSVERVSLGNLRLIPSRKARNRPDEPQPDAERDEEPPTVVRTGESILIIRQTQSVHARIEQFIRDLLRTTTFQLHEPQPINQGAEGGGGGFF